jgi:hypothetical protein
MTEFSLQKKKNYELRCLTWVFGGRNQMVWNNEVQSLTGYCVGYCVEEDFLENINLIAHKKAICFFFFLYCWNTSGQSYISTLQIYLDFVKYVFEFIRYLMVHVEKYWSNVNLMKWNCERKISKSSNYFDTFWNILGVFD